ncbi:GNAT family N-acetyltransferase [Saccharibacillus kuerlensis]|uniref:Acetyltransferase n=1 Tax=Saccharibacillus kuerlensis TaxID=459527 RepID=A0ABQ2L3N6_9BACL|nr:GNAT family N-acetyltransferase [Saccharibacillus kuerlensis]GGO01109.1 acetyltransferase [Saccharibacillus kuerlensis]
MLETERLIFRSYSSDDLHLLLEMTSNPDIMKFIRHGNPWTKEEAIESLNRYIGWNNEGIGLYLAFNKQNSKLVGHSGLIPQIIEDINELEVGYWVVKDEWGKGYGLEQAKAWKEYGLMDLEHPRLISLIQNGNIGSIKVAEKNGMKHEKDIELLGKRVAVYSICIT